MSALSVVMVSTLTERDTEVTLRGSVVRQEQGLYV